MKEVNYSRLIKALYPELMEDKEAFRRFYLTVAKRISRGASVDDAILTPIRERVDHENMA